MRRVETPALLTPSRPQEIGIGRLLPAFPVTPPDMRVRLRWFGGLRGPGSQSRKSRVNRSRHVAARNAERVNPRFATAMGAVRCLLTADCSPLLAC